MMEDSCIYAICRFGSVEELESAMLIDSNRTIDNLNAGLYGACKSGRIELVKSIIYYGACYWNWGLLGACEGSHMELVKLMISNGASYWNWGLLGACTGGDLEIIDLMIEKCQKNDIEWGISGACTSNKLDIVKYLLNYYKDNWESEDSNDSRSTLLSWGLICACVNGHLGIAEYVMDQIDDLSSLDDFLCCQEKVLEKCRKCKNYAKLEINVFYLKRLRDKINCDLLASIFSDDIISEIVGFF
jgi:hypothetical protein